MIVWVRWCSVILTSEAAPDSDAGIRSTSTPLLSLRRVSYILSTFWQRYTSHSPAMSTVSLSAVVLCVSLLAAVFLSYLFPTLRLPSSSASSAAVLEAAYLGDLNEVRRLLAVYSNQSHSQQRQQPQRSIDALLRDSRNNTALHVSPTVRSRTARPQ